MSDHHIDCQSSNFCATSKKRKT